MPWAVSCLLGYRKWCALRSQPRAWNIGAPESILVPFLLLRAHSYKAKPRSTPSTSKPDSRKYQKLPETEQILFSKGTTLKLVTDPTSHQYHLNQERSTTRLRPLAAASELALQHPQLPGLPKAARRHRRIQRRPRILALLFFLMQKRMNGPCSNRENALTLRRAERNTENYVCVIGTSLLQGYIVIEKIPACVWIRTGRGTGRKGSCLIGVAG